jgi:hypothetical protein
MSGLCTVWMWVVLTAFRRYMLLPFSGSKLKARKQRGGSKQKHRGKKLKPTKVQLSVNVLVNLFKLSVTLVSRISSDTPFRHFTRNFLKIKEAARRMCVHVMIQDDESAALVLMLVIYHHYTILTRHACILARRQDTRPGRYRASLSTHLERTDPFAASSVVGPS